MSRTVYTVFILRSVVTMTELTPSVSRKMAYLGSRKRGGQGVGEAGEAGGGGGETGGGVQPESPIILPRSHTVAQQVAF